MTDRQIHRPHNPPPPANKCLLVPTLSVQPSTALKKLNFNCWIRIRIPNPDTDPDPDWRFESGSNRIRIPIRNTAFQYFRIFTFRTYLQHQFGPFTLIMIIQHSPFSAYIYICTVRPVWSRGREGGRNRGDIGV